MKQELDRKPKVFISSGERCLLMSITKRKIFKPLKHTDILVATYIKQEKGMLTNLPLF